MKIYLAGPFFNKQQIKLVEDIRTMLLSIGGVEVFSPMHDSGGFEGVPPSKWPEETRIKVFEKNCEKIEKADIVIAILDYLGVDLLSKDWADDENRLGVPIERKVILPDTGTIWEIGYAHAKKIQVLPYCSTTVGNWNLMLACCFKFILFKNIDDLKRCIELESKRGVWK